MLTFALTSMSPTLEDVRVTPEVFSKNTYRYCIRDVSYYSFLRNKDTRMEMIKIRCCTQVVTPRNQHILDLADMLSMGIEYPYSDGQYLYLDFLSFPSIQTRQ